MSSEPPEERYPGEGKGSWEQRQALKKKRKRIIGISAVVIVVLIIIGAANSGNNSDSAPAAGGSSASANASAPEATLAHFGVVRKQSSCIANPSQAQLLFFVTVENTGSSDGQTTIVPWRRFDDGSTSTGILDQIDPVTIPAFATKKFKLTEDYDPRTQAPLQCKVQVPGDSDPLNAPYFNIALTTF